MRRPFVIGLTGSIGMGKTTTAQMFADEGLPVWNADEAVHRLYASGGSAVEPIAAICPQALKSGTIDRNALKEWIAQDETALRRIEAIVHPLLIRDRADFLARTDADIVLFDVPLLFETGLANTVDASIVVSAPEDEQERRVLKRGTMDKVTFEAIRAKQMPDRVKRARADFVIETSSLEAAREQVQTILKQIRDRLTHA